MVAKNLNYNPSNLAKCIIPCLAAIALRTAAPAAWYPSSALCFLLGWAKRKVPTLKYAKIEDVSQNVYLGIYALPELQPG